LFLQQGVHLVVFHRFGELFTQLFEGLQQITDFGDAFLDIAEYVLVRVEFRLLRQIADPHFPHGSGFAQKIFVETGHDAQQTRLARTVVSQHPDLGPRIERQVDPVEDDPPFSHYFSQVVHDKDEFLGQGWLPFFFGCCRCGAVMSLL